MDRGGLLGLHPQQSAESIAEVAAYRESLGIWKTKILWPGQAHQIRASVRGLRLLVCAQADATRSRSSMRTAGQARGYRAIHRAVILRTGKSAEVVRELSRTEEIITLTLTDSRRTNRFPTPLQKEAEHGQVFLGVCNGGVWANSVASRRRFSSGTRHLPRHRERHDCRGGGRYPDDHGGCDHAAPWCSDARTDAAGKRDSSSAG